MLISSLQNKRILGVNRLRKKRERDQSRLFLVDGLDFCLLAYKNGWCLKEVYFNSSLIQKDFSQLQVLFPKLDINQFVEVSPAVFEKISYGDTQSGFVGVFSQESPFSLEYSANSRFFVVLDNIEKPGNIGAVCRTCDALGSCSIFLTNPKTDLFNPNVIRSSLGTFFSLPTFIVGDPEELFNWLKDKNSIICSLSPESKNEYTDYSFKEKTTLVVGSEHLGVSPFWKEKADELLSVRMNGVANSLNVSISLAVVLFEASRQLK